jgi:hypothetical protein
MTFRHVIYDTGSDSMTGLRYSHLIFMNHPSFPGDETQYI